MTNTQRQRRFRQNHPGYHQRIHAQKRARVKAFLDEQQAIAKAKTAALPAPLTVAVPLALPMPPERLMLPAPVEVLVFPGLKTIETVGVAVRD